MAASCCAREREPRRVHRQSRRGVAGCPIGCSCLSTSSGWPNRRSSVTSAARGPRLPSTSSASSRLGFSPRSSPFFADHRVRNSARLQGWLRRHLGWLYHLGHAVIVSVSALGDLGVGRRRPDSRRDQREGLVHRDARLLRDVVVERRSWLTPAAKLITFLGTGPVIYSLGPAGLEQAGGGGPDCGAGFGVWCCPCWLSSRWVRWRSDRYGRSPRTWVTPKGGSRRGLPATSTTGGCLTTTRMGAPLPSRSATGI